MSAPPERPATAALLSDRARHCRRWIAPPDVRSGSRRAVCSASWAAHNALLLPWETRNIDADLLEPALIALRALTWLVPSVLYLRRYDPRRRSSPSV